MALTQSDMPQLLDLLNQIDIRVQVRRKTAAAWAASNEVLLNGEWGLETDTGRVKLGDGVTGYNALPYKGETPGIGTLTATFDAGDNDIDVGAYCDVYVPYGFKATRATLLSGSVGSITVDVRASPLATFPPSAGASICGGNPPSLTGADKSQDSPLAGWSTTAGAVVVRFVVTACAGVRRASLLIEVEPKWQG